MERVARERESKQSMKETERKDDRMAEKDTRRGSTSKGKVVGVWFV